MINESTEFPIALAPEGVEPRRPCLLEQVHEVIRQLHNAAVLRSVGAGLGVSVADRRQSSELRELCAS